ncbi:MAG: metallophosphoesterase family protein [Pararhodobacter sp.]
MTRIVHLSDLHFGAEDPELLEPLRKAVIQQEPDLVVVSGDLAQRGTRREFALAQAWLDRLPKPQLCVPGNHDLPHFHPLKRLLDPYGRFKGATRTGVEPDWRDEGAVVVGINTADRLLWKRGRVTEPHIRRLSDIFADAGSRARVAVMHHPLEHAALNVDRLMHNSAGLLEQMPKMGAQIVLSGHVHVSYIGPFRNTPEVLFVQTGTSLSIRRRGESNSFTVLDLRGDTARISVHHAGPQGFVAAPAQNWALRGGRWTGGEMS